MSMAQGIIRFPQKFVSIEGCNPTWVSQFLSLTLTLDDKDKNVQPFALFRLSYMYYTLVGAFTAIAVGILVSFATGGNKKAVHRNLLSPVIHKLLAKPEISNTNGVEEIVMAEK